MGYHCDVLIERASEAQSVRELFRTASPRLRRLVDFDAAVWLATDPGTGLPTAPTFVENLDHLGRGPCERVWELEFQVDDVNLYRDLAGAAVPAGALRLSTDDRPARSHRYCDLLHPNGLGDEVRSIRLRAGDIFHVPGNETHGFRNQSQEPAVMLITTTVRIGRFFQKVADATPEQFAAIAERYGHAVDLE